MKKDHVLVVLEDLQSQIQRLAESMADVPRNIRKIIQRLDSMDADMRLEKGLVRDHEGRITKLESSVYD